jgi:hypothetical protein
MSFSQFCRPRMSLFSLAKPALKPNTSASYRQFASCTRTQAQYRIGGSGRPNPRYSRFQQAQTQWKSNPSFRYGVLAVGAGGGVFFVSNLEKVPVCGVVLKDILNKNGHSHYFRYLDERDSMSTLQSQKKEWPKPCTSKLCKRTPSPFYHPPTLLRDWFRGF